MKRTFADELCLHIKAGYAALFVNSSEEARALREIRRAGWKMADGRRAQLKPVDRNRLRTLFNDDQYLQFACRFQGDELICEADKLIQLLTVLHETEDAGVALVESVLDSVGYPVVTWDGIRGFSSGPKAEDLMPALLAVDAPWDEDPSKNFFPARCLVVFKDCHAGLNHPEVGRYRRALREMVDANQNTVNETIRRPMIFLQPDWVPHPDIAHCLTSVEFSLPAESELAEVVDYVESSAGSVRCPVELRPDVVRALRGFTYGEAVDAVFYAVAAHKGFAPEVLQTLHDVKGEMLRRGEVLEYIDATAIAASDEIGGYENWKAFVAECKDCYTPEAETAGLRKPKGALLLGLPGSGKSVAAMATARMMGLPLVKYDLGAVFSSLVGDSEARQRRSLRQITAMGACVLMVDEADKAFAGIDQTSRSDGGVGQRVFGRLLSWMAQENDEAFVVMTMNSLQGVPLPLIRAGRLDAIFYTSLPHPAERLDILRIHLRKNRVDPDVVPGAVLDQVVRDTEDFVGSELEQVVVRAIRAAWAARRTVQPAESDWQAALKTVNPVVKLDEEGMKAIMTFCQKQAIPVSAPRTAPVRQQTVGRAKRTVDPGGD